MSHLPGTDACQILLAAELPFFFTHLMPAVLILVGGSMTLGAIASLFQAIASYGWPATSGNVVGANVEESSGGGESDYTVRTPKLEYAYQVGGASHVGTRITLSDRTLGSPAEAAAFLKEFQKGAAVTVRYHPKEPSKCVLRPGVSFGNIMGFFFPLIFLTGGIALFRIIPTLHH